MFRDLSDKLFTSEIIELHENQIAKQDLNELRMNFVPQTEGDGLEASDISENEHQNKETAKPVFHDLGEYSQFFLGSFENFE